MLIRIQFELLKFSKVTTLELHCWTNYCVLIVYCFHCWISNPPKVGYQQSQEKCYWVWVPRNVKGQPNSSFPFQKSANNGGFAHNKVRAVEQATNNRSWRVRTLCLVDLIKRCEAQRRGADSGAAKNAPCIAVAGATGFCAGNGRYARYVITIKRQFMILTRRRGCGRIGRTVLCGVVVASGEINLNVGSLPLWTASRVWSLGAVSEWLQQPICQSGKLN